MTDCIIILFDPVGISVVRIDDIRIAVVGIAAASLTTQPVCCQCGRCVVPTCGWMQGHHMSKGHPRAKFSMPPTPHKRNHKIKAFWWPRRQWQSQRKLRNRLAIASPYFLMN